MDRFVSLDSLPEGLQFPPEFDGRISYDPARQRLSYRGFMSKGEFDRLYRLSNHWPYRRALEELFRRCTVEAATEARRGGLRRILAAVTGL